MKITSINVLKEGDIEITARDTQKNRNVQLILNELEKHDGDDLVIAADKMKKFERYGLQKALQERGAHITVKAGTDKKTEKLVLVIHQLTDSEWKEYTLGETTNGKKKKK